MLRRSVTWASSGAHAPQLWAARLWSLGCRRTCWADRCRSHPGLPAAAGVAFVAQFFVCRILFGGYYGVMMLRAVLALQPPQVSLGVYLEPSNVQVWLQPVCRHTALSMFSEALSKLIRAVMSRASAQAHCHRR